MAKPSVAALINPDKEGFLVKQGGLIRNWKKRWFVLKGDTLYYFKTRSDSEPSGKIQLDEHCRIGDGSGKTGRKDSLELTTAERNYYFYVDAPIGAKHEVDEWKDAIERAIKEAAAHSSSHTSSPHQTPTTPHGTIKPAGRTLEVLVRGMLCECCEKKVRNTIAKIKGVQNIEINIEEEKVKITANKIDVGELLTALEDAGFLPAVL
jgi:copper chaperone CopZ